MRIISTKSVASAKGTTATKSSATAKKASTAAKAPAKSSAATKSTKSVASAKGTTVAKKSTSTAKAPAKTTAKAPAKTTAKAPAKSTAKAPAKTTAKATNTAKSASTAKSTTKAPVKATSTAKSTAKAPAAAKTTSAKSTSSAKTDAKATTPASTATAEKTVAKTATPATESSEKSQQELTVEERLQHLYELQRIDSEIDKIRTIRGELPLEVQDLEDELAGLTTRVEKLKEGIAADTAEIAKRKNGIVAAEELKKKYESQVDAGVRNSREFDALNKEIEYQGLEIELHQKKIREAERDQAERETALAETEEIVKERLTELDVKKGELDNIIAEYHAKEEEMSEESKRLAAKIEPRLLTAYQRIRANARNGLAVVTVDRDACGGCFNNIPPQRQLDICSHKKIIVCEYCGRILVDKYICDYDGSQRKADEEAARNDASKRKSRRTKKLEMLEED